MKGAVVVTHWQNEAEVKFQIDITGILPELTKNDRNLS